MKRVVAAIEKATVELEASLSTQAVAESRVSRAESESSRSRVEELRVESRESVASCS